MKDINPLGVILAYSDGDSVDEVKDTSVDEVKPKTRAPEKKDPKIVEGKPLIDVLIKPQTIQIPMFRINGLTPELEKEALKKLSQGVPRDEILEFYGICAADISVVC